MEGWNKHCLTKTLTQLSIHILDCLQQTCTAILADRKLKKQQKTADNTIILKEMAAKVINSAMPAPRVIVELEPNVCVADFKSIKVMTL